MGYAGEIINFRGEFSSADARAATLTEATARVSLYIDGTTSAITLAATDRVTITGISAAAAATITVELYGGSDDTVDAGESLMYFRLTSALGVAQSNLNIACMAGTYPKVETSAIGQIDVVLYGYVVRGAAS
jgi:hypothetical protein